MIRLTMAIFKTMLCARRRKPFVFLFDNVELNKSRTMREQGSVKGGFFHEKRKLRGEPFEGPSGNDDTFMEQY
jgi:hypothetical protein